MNGGFYPLKGHMCQADYDGVVKTMCTADGTLFPMPITPDVSEKLAEGVGPGQDIVLRDLEGVSVLDISGTELPAGCEKGWRSLTGSPSPKWSRNCAAAGRHARNRASRFTSPTVPARANRPSPMR